MKNNTSQNIILFLSAFLLLFAPIIRASNLPMPLLILELTGLCILLLIFFTDEQKKKIPKLLWFILLTTLVVPLLYLIPLPENIVNMLSGRELYQSVLQWVSDNSLPPLASAETLSLIPEKTLDSFLSLIPVAAIFLATMSLSVNKTKILCYIFLGMVGIEAIIAIAQFTNSNDALYFGMPNTHNSQGTYRNRDHFSALIEMSLPITIALLAISFSHNNRKHRHNDLVSRFSSHETLIFATLVILMLLAAIFSKSRSGIFLVLFGILIATLSFARHIGGKQSIGVMATLSAFGIGIASSIGIIPIINRFIVADPLKDERGRIFEHTIEVIQNFYPFGSGPGTLPSVYRAFQPIDQMHFINHAHNDYLELFAETGVIGATILFLFIGAYLMGWFKVLQSPWLRFRYIQMGAGIGMFLLLLHALTDFNFHIPANMIFFAFLAGLFFHSSEKNMNKVQHRVKTNVTRNRTTTKQKAELGKKKRKSPFAS